MPDPPPVIKMVLPVSFMCLLLSSKMIVVGLNKPACFAADHD